MGDFVGAEDVGVSAVIAIEIVDVFEVTHPFIDAQQIEIGGADEIDRPLVSVKEAADLRDILQLFFLRARHAVFPRLFECCAGLRACRAWPATFSGFFYTMSQHGCAINGLLNMVQAIKEFACHSETRLPYSAASSFEVSKRLSKAASENTRKPSSGRNPWISVTSSARMKSRISSEITWPGTRIGKPGG